MAIHLTRISELAVVTLDRPEVLNALNFEMLRDLGAAFDQVADGDARALLVTGAGDRAFCAGLDALQTPSIALINGYAFGGGLELALACTFRLAGRGASFGLPEIKLGLIPGYGGTQRLPRLIGEARALEIIMLGRTVSAEEAAAIGLIHRIVDDEIVAEAIKFTKEFSSYSLIALGLARDAVMRALDVPIHEGLKIEADLSTLAFSTADAEEGMAAFTERRKAV